MRKRKVWIEPMFGEAKQWHGMERTRLRMLERVNCEALLTASGQNIKRLLTFGSRGPRRPAQVTALRPPERPRLLPIHHLPVAQRYVFQHAAQNGTVTPYMRPAARVKFNSSATATKYLRCLSSTWILKLQDLTNNKQRYTPDRCALDHVRLFKKRRQQD
jgi:hypothetical protein